MNKFIFACIILFFSLKGLSQKSGETSLISKGVELAEEVFQFSHKTSIEISEIKNIHQQNEMIKIFNELNEKEETDYFNTLRKHDVTDLLKYYKINNPGAFASLIAAYEGTGAAVKASNSPYQGDEISFAKLKKSNTNEIKLLNKIRILNIQKELNSLGAEIKEDSIMGSKTKIAIEKYMKIPTKSMSTKEIELEIYAKKYPFPENTSLNHGIEKYKLNVEHNGESIMSEKELSKEQIQKKMDELSNTVECNFDNICLGKKCDLTLECKDAKSGDKITINISTDGNIELKMKDKGGKFLKVSGGADGVKITSGDNKQTRTIDLK